MGRARTGPRSPRSTWSPRSGRAPWSAVAGAALLAALAPAAPCAASADAPVRLRHRVVAVYPHDAGAFTQGLLFHDGVLYESTGGYGESRLRRVDPERGAVLAERALDPDLFGEGLARVGDRLVVLTWRAGRALVHDRRSLRPLGEHRYPGEGWGLTHDGGRLVMSDGTARLRFLDPHTFAPLGEVRVHDRGRPVGRLNELEMVRGRLWANVWLTDRIAVIDPASGRVVAWLDLAGLLPSVFALDEDAVLNGIAYDPVGDRIFVTGKRWPRLFQIDVDPARP